MDEKKADNNIVNIRKEIDYIDEKIHDKKESLNDMEGLSMLFNSINKDLYECIGLVNSSVKNKSVNNKLDAFSSDNITSFSELSNSIDIEIDKVNNEIRNFNYEREEKLKSVKNNIQNDLE